VVHEGVRVRSKNKEGGLFLMSGKGSKPWIGGDGLVPGEFITSRREEGAGSICKKGSRRLEIH